jgi:hypothetical protein
MHTISSNYLSTLKHANEKSINHSPLHFISLTIIIEYKSM